MKNLAYGQEMQMIGDLFHENLKLENAINGAYELINSLYKLCKEEISKTNNEEVKACYAKLMFLIDESMLIIN